MTLFKLDENYQDINPRVGWWLFFLLVIIGLLLRYQDYSEWTQLPQKGLAFGEQAYTTTYDGYFYLSQARDILNGSEASAFQTLRGIPDEIAEQDTSLLSTVLAFGSAVTDLPLHHFAALAMPMTIVFIALGVLLFGRSLGGWIAGLIAVLFVVASPYLRYRTNIGWIDTDGMNVAFSVLVAWFALGFGRNQTKTRYWYAAGWAICTLLYLAWWPMGRPAALWLSMAPFAIAIALFFRPAGREAVVAWAGLAGLALYLLTVHFQVFADLIIKGISQLQYVMKSHSGVFPRLGASVSEQGLAPMQALAKMTVGHDLAFVAGVMGLTLLVFDLRKALYLSGLVVLGLLAFKFSQRFTIFLVPLICLGIGYLAAALWRLGRGGILVSVLVPLLAVGAAVPALETNWKQTSWPKPRPEMVSYLRELRAHTEPDAVVWAWWDYAYPIMYWGNRATLADGAFHPGERLMYLGYPLTAASPRAAANFMRFFTERGGAGVRKVYAALGGNKAAGFRLIQAVMRAGPDSASEIFAGLAPTNPAFKQSEHWNAFFFPQASRPLYLVLDRDMEALSYWWFWYGSWDLASQSGVHPLTPMRIPGVGDLGENQLGAGKFWVDIATGAGKLQNKPISIASLSQAQGREVTIRKYAGRPESPALTVYDGGRAVLYDHWLGDSLFGQLFFQTAAQTAYFSPVLIDFGVFQLWRVQADPGRR